MNIQSPSAMRPTHLDLEDQISLNKDHLEINQIFQSLICKLPEQDTQPKACFVMGPVNQGKIEFIRKMAPLFEARLIISLDSILCLLSRTYQKDNNLQKWEPSANKISYGFVDLLKKTKQSFWFDVHPSYPLPEQTLKSLKSSGYDIHIYDINTPTFSTLLPVYKQYSEVIGRYYQEKPECMPILCEHLYLTQGSSEWNSKVLDTKLLDKVKEEEKERGSP